MFNLEGLIPKLCQLSREFGDDERALCLRAGGMQTLAVFVRFLSVAFVLHLPLRSLWFCVFSLFNN